MAKNVIMPALGMAQETGTLIQWLKAPGDAVTKGEPLMEIETDKATAEVEAVASGILANVTAHPGDVIPVGQAIAIILAPDDLGGGTFTISNLGMYGVDAFNAIVNPPQVAILAVSRIADRVVPVQGQPGIQPMLTLSLSCDHRAVDGARGAQFLQTLAGLTEEPMRLWD